MSRAYVLVALEIQHLSLVFSRQKFWTCLFKLNLHFHWVCLCPLAGWSTSYGILSMMLINASYTHGSCWAELSSKKYENLSAKFLKEGNILKQSNVIQAWEEFFDCSSWIRQIPILCIQAFCWEGKFCCVMGKTPLILEISRENTMMCLFGDIATYLISETEWREKRMLFKIGESLVTV